MSISKLAFSVSQSSKKGQHPISLGHSQQLVAALFGYKSLASYQEAVKNSKEIENFDDIRFFIVDEQLLISRHAELQIELEFDVLSQYIDDAFEAHFPKSYIFDSLEDCVEDYLQTLEKNIENDGRISSQIADANFDGIEYAHIEYDPETVANLFRAEQDVILEGTVTLGIDIERPYSGHSINFNISLYIEKLSDRFIKAFDYEVGAAELDRNWNDDDIEYISAAQALANLLGINLEDAEKIEDVETVPLDGSTGDMIFSYMLDFSNNSPEIIAKILEHNSELEIEVDRNFFENIENWPYN